MCIPIEIRDLRSVFPIFHGIRRAASDILRRTANRVLALALALLTFAGPAAAQEYVSVRGALADEDFYRVVACAATPGSPCRKPFLRWSSERRRDLTVGFAGSGARAGGAKASAFETALDTAMREVNALDAGLRLRRSDAVPDIAIYIVPTAPGRVMRNTGVPELDGVRLPLARVSIRTRSGEIRRATIAISAQARRHDVASLLLEEIVQGLGLITDIRGRAYHGSIFAEDSNSTVALRGQDAMALRRHYGKPERYAALEGVEVETSASSEPEVPPSVRLRRLGSLRKR